MKKRKRYFSFALSLILMMSLLTGCGPKRATKETDMSTIGIDIAKYQGTIDWETLSATGINFAIVRLGYRSSADGSIVEDSNARYNMQEAAKNGIALGAYFFSTAISPEEAQEEAQWVADIIAQYPITYPVVYDCEGYDDPESRQNHMSAAERTDVALAFLKAIEKKGYEGMFYASKHELENNWDTARIEKDYKIWVAQYPAEPYPQTQQSSYEGKHHMWQYTKSGTLLGIDQYVDLNVAYFGYDGIEPPKDPNPPEEVGPDVEALMKFTETNETVTAKDETNLRDRPSQDADSQIIYTLKNGETAQRIAVSESGWSKLLFGGQTCYAVSSYLTTDLNHTPGTSSSQMPDADGDGIITDFEPTDQMVTAKELVNLRSLPSVEREDSKILGQLKKYDLARRVGISSNGWSKLEYNGQTCYAVSSYLTPADGSEETKPQGDEIKTQFEQINDSVTPKEKVNLRSIPSVDDPRCEIVATIYKGDVVTRTGINRDVGWSRVEYNGRDLYCVTSLLTEVETPEIPLT